MELVWHFDLKKFMTGTDFFKVHTAKTTNESKVIFENPCDREKKRKNDLEDHLIKNHLDSNETKSLKVRCLFVCATKNSVTNIKNR